MWLAGLPQRHSHHDPDRLAMIDDEGSITYAELASRCEAVASALREHGIQRGDRVLVLSRNRIAALEAYMSVTRAGGVVVPINHGLTADEVRHTVELTQAAAAIGERALLDASVATDNLGFVWDIEQDYEQHARQRPTHTAPYSGTLEDPAAILCTSATTGLPKGVVLTHRTFQHQALAWLATTGLGRDVTYLAAPPVFHSTVTVALSYLAAGGTVVLTRNFTPQRCAELMTSHSVTHAYLVPSMIDFLLRSRGLSDADLPSLQEVFHGAAPMGVEQRQEAAGRLGCALRDCYGQAEAGGPVTLADPLAAQTKTNDPERWRSAGRPLLGFETRVVDQDGQALPPGELGEVTVRSPATMRGYWKNDGASAEAIKHGWLWTGDLGTLSPGGDLTILDRRTDMIIRGGQNVYPAELERVLNQHPGVAAAAVVGAADSALGEVPVAFVVSADGATLDSTELIAFAGRHLAPYKRPTAIHLLSELPRNPAGKVLKRQLRAPTTTGV